MSNILIIDYAEGTERFLGKKTLYEEFLARFIDENDFPTFFKAMEEEDYAKAYMYGHSLKGVVGNLSCNALFQKMIIIVDMLRNNTDIVGAINFMPQIKEEYDRLIKEIKSHFQLN